MQHSEIHLLLVDNEDSFTWNLVQLFEETGATVSVQHPSAVHSETLSSFHGLILSPGPGLPEEMPGLMNLVSDACRQVPVLGVCFGHQAIAMHFGAKLFRMEHILHGRRGTINITEKENGIFRGLPEFIQVGLYHSWAIDQGSFPPSLIVTATSEEENIMAFRHRELPVYGVQFHPESYITEHGMAIASNWLQIVESNLKGR